MKLSYEASYKTYGANCTKDISKEGQKGFIRPTKQDIIV